MSAGPAFGTAIIAGTLASVALTGSTGVITLFAAAVLCAYGIAVMFL